MQLLLLYYKQYEFWQLNLNFTKYSYRETTGMLKITDFWWHILNWDTKRYTTQKARDGCTNVRHANEDEYHITRGPARSGCCTCPPLQNLSQKLRRRHMARENKAPHACLVKRTPPSANREQKWELDDSRVRGTNPLRIFKRW